MGRKIEVNPNTRAKVEIAIAGNQSIVKSDSKKKRSEIRQALWAVIRDEIKAAAANARIELTVVDKRATAILKDNDELQAKRWFSNILHNGRLPRHREITALAQVLGIEESDIDAHLRLAPWVMDMVNLPKNTTEDTVSDIVKSSADAQEQKVETIEREILEGDDEPEADGFNTAEEIAAIVFDYLEFRPEGASLRKKAYDLHTAAQIIDLLAAREEEWKRIGKA